MVHSVTSGKPIRLCQWFVLKPLSAMSDSERVEAFAITLDTPVPSQSSGSRLYGINCKSWGTGRRGDIYTQSVPFPKYGLPNLYLDALQGYIRIKHFVRALSSTWGYVSKRSKRTYVYVHTRKHVFMHHRLKITQSTAPKLCYSSCNYYIHICIPKTSVFL